VNINPDRRIGRHEPGGAIWRPSGIATGLKCYARLYPRFQAGRMMAMPYRHTQPGILILICCLLCGALGAAGLWRSGQWPPAIALTVILLAVAFVFSSLTVEVSDSELRWHFGPGLWTYRLPLDEVSGWKRIIIV
jgi:hypothetical protein